MSNITFADRDAVDRAIADVRNDNTATNWALFGYTEGSKNEISVVGTGSGGHTELNSKFQLDKIQYGFLRVNDTYDNHTTVKFVLINWVGEKVKFIQRALITTHKGAVNDFIGQHHVAFYASNHAESSEENLMARVTDASGSSNKVLQEENRTGAVASAGSGALKREVGGSGSGEFAVAQEDNVRTTIAALRNGDKSWLLLSYQGNTNTLELVGSGNGNVSELTAGLKADGISYGLYRTTVKVDESVTVKFVKIQWVGENVAAVRKAKVTTFVGTVDVLLGQSHVDIYANNLSEVSEEIVTQKVNNASGVAVHVRDNVVSPVAAPAQPKPAVVTAAPTKVAPAPAADKAYRGAGSAAPGSSTTKTAAGPGAPKAGGGVVVFLEEESIKSAIQDLRKDTGKNWVLIGYQSNGTTLEMNGTGSGGLSELKAAIANPVNVHYGLLRTTEKIDDSVTTKFVLVIYISDKLPGLKKARIATHKGAVTEFFGQYHVDVNVSSLDELTDELVLNAVQKAAGTKVNVK